jgi:hypothetical protein
MSEGLRGTYEKNFVRSLRRGISMTKVVSGKKARSIFSIANKYQATIILLTFFPSTVIFLLFICLIFIINPGISDAAFHTSFVYMEKFISRFPWVIALLMGLVLFLSLIGAYVVSRNIVGAFGRVNRELDEIIAGRSQQFINSRPEDGLMKDLLKRVNVLVSYYVENKNKR